MFSPQVMVLRIIIVSAGPRKEKENAIVCVLILVVVELEVGIGRTKCVLIVPFQVAVFLVVLRLLKQ